jgi:DnaJ-class molecular chaperone
VSPRASQETIEAAYKSLARRYHPDVNKNKTGEIMKHINMAYQVLKDPGKRAAYNRSVGLA